MDDSTQQIREHILRQIRTVLSEFLPNVRSGTMRILGDTPHSILDPEDYLESIRPFVSETEQYLQEYNPDNQTRFVAVKICRGKHSYFVLDLNNTDYNYDTAHECKKLILVYGLRLSKRQPTLFRKQEVDQSVPKILRNMYNLHGQDPLPLFDNHYDENLSYPNPRNPQIDRDCQCNLSAEEVEIILLSYSASFNSSGIDLDEDSLCYGF